MICKDKQQLLKQFVSFYDTFPIPLNEFIVFEKFKFMFWTNF